MSAVPAANDPAQLQALFHSLIRRAPQTESTAPAARDTDADTLLVRIGQITRTLHESLRALGYDRILEDTVSTIPDTRDRLAYVASMTERAAERVLAATEVAKPMQERLEADAGALAERWRRVFAGQSSVDEFKTLSCATLSFLDHATEQARSTKSQLLEIMMAQDFQDLTGQVIKRVNELVHRFEQELLLLLENTPAERRPAGSDGLLNGPVVSTAPGADVVTTQAQVDSLLASLGY